MKKDENYRPVHIEFDVATDGSLMPENFGKFETAEDAIKFIGGNLVSINQDITVCRHMDHVEKKMIRERYNDVLENELPLAEKRLAEKTFEFKQAKNKMDEANETVNASLIEVKTLSQEVKRGLVEMKLDENYTFKIPYKNRFYIYTYIDKFVRLVAIRDMNGTDQNELFSSSASNEEFIETNFSSTNESVKP